MALLVILAAAFEQCDHDQLRLVLGNLFGGPSGAVLQRGLVVYPAGIPLDTATIADTIAYRGGLGLEANPEIWRPLRARRFDEILVIGIDPQSSSEEIILACYLDAARKSFMGNGGIRDIADWQRVVVPDYSPGPVRLRRLGDDARDAYVRRVHRWLGEELVNADYGPPVTRFKVSPETLIYRWPHLGADLAHRTEDLRVVDFEAPHSHQIGFDGTFVSTGDWYRSLANFVGAIDGMQSVLDVGCGSGLLTCHLAGLGRYADVLGIDASPERVAGAKLNAELNRSTARFELRSMADIQLPDRSVDISVTSYALEQTGRDLARCFAEIRRVTRRMMILFEPAIEFFPSLPSLWHVPRLGWATAFHTTLMEAAVSYAVRPILLSRYENCGAVFVIDLESREHPRLRFPQLFGTTLEAWPGGVVLS